MWISPLLVRAFAPHVELVGSLVIQLFMRLPNISSRILKVSTSLMVEYCLLQVHSSVCSLDGTDIPDTC